MNTDKKNLRTCANGHQYYKSSDCPTCPVCEQETKPESGFLSAFVGPARRALQNNGISSAADLSRFTEKEVMAFHGMGPASLPKLKEALKKAGLSFKSN